MQEVTLKLDGIQTNASVQQINLDSTACMATAAEETSTQVSASFTASEESLQKLWAQQPPVESEAKFTGEIHVLNSNF
ncbi:hypothetical protein DSO57_1014146 [Entomophthora muscae]|uniref:Uncharacterized protein n=1 Tax=Entomophthora muscae TaxID=34485 RepID=A0ACC2RWJ0_9FUNG|nr:hypothetical protein DSO57_1014146 [Entomophthora muscae]